MAAKGKRLKQRARRIGVDKPPDSGVRFNTSPAVQRLVWTRAAGHCELCGHDLTRDFRSGRRMRWGEVAHILPASPMKGPRAEGGHGLVEAESRTNDVDNLMLLCRNCHTKGDRNAEGYPKEDLQGLHRAYLQRIELAAQTPDAGRALGLIFLSQHFDTRNEIRSVDLLAAMSGEGLFAIDEVMREVLPAPGSAGRDSAYWTQVTDRIHHQLRKQISRASTFHGDVPALAVAGLADIPALIMLGQSIGDRSARYLFSPNRGHGLRWPDHHASPPKFFLRQPEQGPREGPVALVLSLSASVPLRDVTAALPDAPIYEFTIDSPSYNMVKNRNVIHAFRDELQAHLSVLEARSPAPIHLFPAVPAALAIEFGALLTTQHRHPYIVYDRDQNGAFVPAVGLPNPEIRA